MRKWITLKMLLATCFMLPAVILLDITISDYQRILGLVLLIIATNIISLDIGERKR